MTDLAEVRAEGRRLVAEYRRVTESPREYYERLAAGSRWAKWVLLHADVLLADPAPVGLTEAERRWLDATMTDLVNGYSDDVHWARPTITRLLDIIDRLSAAPVDDRERVPEGWRVEWTAGSPWWNGKPRLVPMSPSVDPEEKPDA